MRRNTKGIILQAKLPCLVGTLFGIIFAALVARPVRAHGGGPIPVLLGEQVGPYTLSVFADPDTGQGLILVEVAIDGKPAPEETTVTVRVWPEDDHAPATTYTAKREKPLLRQERFVVRVPFDAEGVWWVHLTVNGPAGKGETRFPLTVTPPGLPISPTTLVCLVPFFALGALWWWGARKMGRPGAQAE